MGSGGEFGGNGGLLGGNGVTGSGVDGTSAAGGELRRWSRFRWKVLRRQWQGGHHRSQTLAPSLGSLLLLTMLRAHLGSLPWMDGGDAGLYPSTKATACSSID